MSPKNPGGFHPPLIEKGWDRAFAEGVWGEPSLDSTIPKYPNICISRAHGSLGQAPLVIGRYPISGGPVECEPRGPQSIAVAEAQVPGFWKALKPRIAMAHAAGGRVMVYYGTPPESLFAQNMLAERRNALLDALIEPAIEAGMGANDLIGCDACAATSQRKKTDGMYFAERVIHRGIGFCVESAEQVHPELYPWFNGRFSCVSPHNASAEFSRWGLVVRDRNWFGPGMPWTVKEHFVSLQGGSEGVGKTTADRITLVPPETVNGTAVRTMMEMSDFPLSAFGA